MIFGKFSHAAGSIPGALVHVGAVESGDIVVSVIDYDESEYREEVINSPEDCARFKESSTVTWINVSGIHKPEIVETIGKVFDIHPMVLEDIVNTNQRPKTEDYGDYMFTVLKMIYQRGKGDPEVEQVSLILWKNVLITFQEREGDVFNLIRERIRQAKGRIRKQGTDYLAYSLIDAIVDNYFTVIERIGEKLESSEIRISEDPSPEISSVIHRLKREILSIRKYVWPTREVSSSLAKSESKLIKKGTKIFFNDVYDHSVQVIDAVETLRDISSGLLDLYLSVISNKMNEVMKVLTIIATIFIPMTFIAGVYGMNFDTSVSKFNMPELGLKYGYILALSAMGAVGLGMILYFKKKKWL